MSEIEPFIFPYEFGNSANGREEEAALERDAAFLPVEGPIADLVAAIDRELSRCVIADYASWEAAPFLRPFGEEASRLTGSIRGMRAICQKATSLDERRGEYRRDLIDKAWHGLGAGNHVWCA